MVVTEAGAAYAVAESGGAVVLLARDTKAASELAPVVSDLEREGHRVAHFTGDLTEADDRAALAEMIAELFPSSASVEPA